MGVNASLVANPETTATPTRSVIRTRPHARLPRVDTSLDCGFKEFCDPAAGDCYEASGYYCSECRDEDDCGGNGNLCLNFGANGRFCGVTCDTNIDCPSGFECIPVSDGSGNIISKQCLTYCWLYIDDARGPDAPSSVEQPPLRPTVAGSSSDSAEACP